MRLSAREARALVGTFHLWTALCTEALGAVPAHFEVAAALICAVLSEAHAEAQAASDAARESLQSVQTAPLRLLPHDGCGRVV